MMGFLDLFPIVGLFKGESKEKKQEKQNYALALQMLNQYMKEQSAMGKQAFDFGFGTLTEAKGDVNYLEDFFKKILQGDDRQFLMDFADTNAIGDSYSQAESVASELGPRGGARASTLANLPFAKAADINEILTGVRQGAPNALMQLAQMMAGIGGQALGSSANSYGLGGSLIQVPLGLKESERERRNRLIGGLISAGGQIAGAALP